MSRPSRGRPRMGGGQESCIGWVHADMFLEAALAVVNGPEGNFGGSSRGRSPICGRSHIFQGFSGKTRSTLYSMVKYKYSQYTDTPSVTRPVGLRTIPPTSIFGSRA